jgi:mannose-6-phosphate isomerase-like protein (cupin superfamily)
MNNGSKVIKCASYCWRGIEPREYKTESASFVGVTRQTLIGDGVGEETTSFITRYFEVEPEGYSSLERHQHPHSVVVLRGRGSVRLGDEVFDIEPFDCVYIAPGTVHQFRSGGEEPLGFLCVVDRVRDRPEQIA